MTRLITLDDVVLYQNSDVKGSTPKIWTSAVNNNLKCRGTISKIWTLDENNILGKEVLQQNFEHRLPTILGKMALYQKLEDLLMAKILNGMVL